jgi:uncharacterized protein YkwD
MSFPHFCSPRLIAMSIYRLPATLTVLTLLLFVPRPAQAQQMVPELESPIAMWTNMARHHSGRAPLAANAQLTKAAQVHAWNMAVQETMSHNLGGYTPADRVRWTGYAYSGVAENVAFVFGYDHPAWQLFQSWMTSEGHLRNIQNEQFTEIGVGVARSPSGKYYACQVFGRPITASPYPTAYPAYRAYQQPTWTQPQAADDFQWQYTPRWEWR